MKAASAVVLFLLVAASSVTVYGQQPKKDRVEKEVTAAVGAIYVGDYDLLLRHTHDKVLEIVGGKETFLVALKQATEALQDAGITFEGVEFGKVQYFAGQENEFLVIPTKITIKTADGDTTTAGAQLGVKKKSSKVWKYMDLSALNEKLVRTWFPDYPKDREVPQG